MPLETAMRNLIHTYCVKDLPGEVGWHVNQFSFIADVELQKRLGRAYYSARYIAKLMEALRVDEGNNHPFIKFQIMQYASIFEAVITHLLWNRYADHPEFRKAQKYKAYTKVAALSSKTAMLYGTEELYTCVYREKKKSKIDLKFEEKVDCAVKIGFLEAAYASDVKRVYELRNLAHIENEAEKRIEVELADSHRAYRRMKPFLEKITAKIAEEETDKGNAE